MNSIKPLALALTLVLGSSLATAALLRGPQDAGRPSTKAEEGVPGMDPAMMGAMMKMAMPGAEHRELMAGAGDWKVHYQMRMAPDAPWMDTDGTLKAHPALDGRYLIEETEMSMMGMPIKGMNILGFDNSTGEYTSMWADTMSTWWISSRGKKAADGTIDFRGTMKDIAGERPFRMVVKSSSADEVHITMYDTIPPQGEVEVMRMVSTRAK